jgi:hypothetical protein
VESDRAVGGVGSKVGGSRAETKAVNFLSVNKHRKKVCRKDSRSSASFSHCESIDGLERGLGVCGIEWDELWYRAETEEGRTKSERKLLVK